MLREVKRKVDNRIGIIHCKPGDELYIDYKVDKTHIGGAYLERVKQINSKQCQIKYRRHNRPDSKILKANLPIGLVVKLYREVSVFVEVPDPKPVVVSKAASDPQVERLRDLMVDAEVTAIDSILGHDGIKAIIEEVSTRVGLGLTPSYLNSFGIFPRT